METRTVDVLLQQNDGRLVARLTVRYPPPAAMSYAGQQWHRTGGSGSGDAVYKADRPFARPVSTEEPRLPPQFAYGARRRR
jgi:hypothetical protein